MPQEILSGNNLTHGQNYRQMDKVIPIYPPILILGRGGEEYNNHADIHTNHNHLLCTVFLRYTDAYKSCHFLILHLHNLKKQTKNLSTWSKVSLQLKFHIFVCCCFCLSDSVIVSVTCFTTASYLWWSTLLHNTGIAEWAMKQCSSWCEFFLGHNSYQWLVLARTCVSTSHSGPRDDPPPCNMRKGITVSV